MCLSGVSKPPGNAVLGELEDLDMGFILVAATIVTFATLLTAALWRLVLALRRRSAPGYWRRTFSWHAAVFALHVFVTVPLAFGVLLSRTRETRADERGYTGPRLAPDGTWLLQTRETLRAEAAGESHVEPEVIREAAGRAVSFTARDGVALRGFLVPPGSRDDGTNPRFIAVLVHGMHRGSLEIEAPGDMLRKLGGEVLLLEMRNHGGSGKAPQTWGRGESLDVLAAVDYLRSRAGASDLPLVLFAVSGGTPAVAFAAPQIPSLGGLVLDAPIDDLGARAREVLGNGGFWQAFREPWISTTLFFTRHVGGLHVDAVKPVEALKRLPPEVAVLVIGAGRDWKIPPDSVRRVYEALPQSPDRKQLWIESEATHGKVWVHAPEEYARRLARLCRKVGAGPPV
jgi:hypothetical protein